MKVVFIKRSLSETSELSQDDFGLLVMLTEPPYKIVFNRGRMHKNFNKRNYKGAYVAAFIL